MRWARAPAKVNLTLRIVGRRLDGYHELESLVAFAEPCDWVAFEPDAHLSLEVCGPRALVAGPVDKNLVLRAARALGAQVRGLARGQFRLVKRLPAAAGLGGGSADAAAALRLLAHEGGLSINDPRLRAAARETGADVLVCLCPQARMMRGIGDELGPAIRLPKIFAVLANPQVEAPTASVFAALGLKPGSSLRKIAEALVAPGADTTTAINSLSLSGNDLEAAAAKVAPAIAVVLERLSALPGAKLTRMSGSGATCFALFADRRAAATGARIIAAKHPAWWVAATGLR